MFNAIAEMAASAEKIVFFTGAGMSTESGIPDFRSETGLYSDDEFNGFSPEYILSRTFFMENTEIFYKYYFSRIIHSEAKPNKGHMAIADMGEIIPKVTVITQNIDGLHTAAGNREVVELHGSVYRNYCTGCGKQFGLEYMMKYAPDVPLCDVCSSIVRPDVTLYEEPLDNYVFSKAIGRIEEADMIFAIGSSLTVFPAAGLLDYFRGRMFVIINRDRTGSDARADFVIRESCGDVLGSISDELNERNFK